MIIVGMIERMRNAYPMYVKYSIYDNDTKVMTNRCGRPT